MKFGLCYIPDYHAEYSGSWSDWYEGMIAEVRSGGNAYSFDSAWFAEHRVPWVPHLALRRCSSPLLARENQPVSELGSSVSLLPLNNPVRMAEDYAMA